MKFATVLVAALGFVAGPVAGMECARRCAEKVGRAKGGDTFGWLCQNIELVRRDTEACVFNECPPGEIDDSRRMACINCRKECPSSPPPS